MPLTTFADCTNRFSREFLEFNNLLIAQYDVPGQQNIMQYNLSTIRAPVFLLNAIREKWNILCDESAVCDNPQALAQFLIAKRRAFSADIDVACSQISLQIPTRYRAHSEWTIDNAEDAFQSLLLVYIDSELLNLTLNNNIAIEGFEGMTREKLDQRYSNFLNCLINKRVKDQLAVEAAQSNSGRKLVALLLCLLVSATPATAVGLTNSEEKVLALGVGLTIGSGLLFICICICCACNRGFENDFIRDYGLLPLPDGAQNNIHNYFPQQNAFNGQPRRLGEAKAEIKPEGQVAIAVGNGGLHHAAVAPLARVIPQAQPSRAEVQQEGKRVGAEIVAMIAIPPGGAGVSSHQVTLTLEPETQPEFTEGETYMPQFH